jgi:hypothetical protein
MATRNVVTDDALGYVKRWGYVDFTSTLEQGESQEAVADFVLFDTVVPKYCKVVSGELAEMNQTEKDAVDVALSIVVSVPSGTGYVDVKTMGMDCSANNTAAYLFVKLDAWETATAKVDKGFEMGFHVARLNDGTVSVQSFSDSQLVSGSVPLTVTGTTPDGVGWRVVVDASYQFVVGVEKDASNDQWAQAIISSDKVMAREEPS